MSLKLRPKVRIILWITLLNELRAKIICPNLTPMLSLLSMGKANIEISICLNLIHNQDISQQIGIGGRAMMLLKWQSSIRIFSQIW
jgi:hypothetical protein